LVSLHLIYRTMTKSKFFTAVIVLAISIACVTKKKSNPASSDTGGEQKLSPDSASKIISDSALLDVVEKQTFQYFFEGAEPVSGMARERIHEDNDYPLHDQTIVTSGGSGVAKPP